jgi:KUP system potassium uptake protein
MNAFSQRPSLSQETSKPQAGLAGLALATLGIVYGDIGTSPLYTIRECFHGPHSIGISPVNVLGVLSLVFWSLTAVVTFKYVTLIMRADNKGEGGIFALMALVLAVADNQNGFSNRKRSAVFLAGIFGAALLYGDGMITPSLTVLSAVEGLEIAAPETMQFVVPLSCMILIGLFAMQARGTAGIGMIFGPIMLIWFLTIALLGLLAVAKAPGVLAAVNPVYAWRFFVTNHLHGLVVLGSVVLCITGTEALYADLGHFTKESIRVSWIGFVWPALLCNYFGQGALLLLQPELASNPFFGLTPPFLLYPMVFLATVAAIIASQAMISGMYSLTQQAIQMGLLPRMRIIHTSSQIKGQIYMPEVNWLLLLACLVLVLSFGSSSRLAGAYGIAVTATMSITSVIYFFVLTRCWKWPAWKAGLLVGLFLAFDCSYFGTNLLKILDGGWFTVMIALLVTLVMTAWRDGRAALAQTMSEGRMDVESFLKDVAASRPIRVPGTAVFMTVSPRGVPGTLLHFFKFNKVFHERVIILSLTTGDTPQVADEKRVRVEDLGMGFFRMVGNFGFMESPNVPKVLRLASQTGLQVEVDGAAYFLGREILLTTGQSGMPQWRKRLFAFMSRNAMNPANFFGIPYHRVVELGAQVNL